MNTGALHSFVEADDKAIVTFLTSINLVDSEHLKKDLTAQLRAKTYALVVFRMDHVHYLDSSGLGLFVTLHHEFRTTTRFQFTGLRANVRLVFEFSHLLHYFTLEEPVQETRDREPPKPPRPDRREPEGKEFLVLEGKYFLTDDGVNYCAQKQIPVQDLRVYRGSAASGFTWSSVNTALLERFVTHGLLAGMELERTEFLSQRGPILRLIEVLFDGIAMKRFRPLLKVKLLKHESYRLLVAQGVSPTRLRTALKQQAEAVARVKTEIQEMVAARPTGGMNSKMPQLLDLVDDSVWFLLVQGQASPGNTALRQTVLDAVVAYSGRLELSGMIALNLMEFLQQAERAHFLNLAERDQFTRKNPRSIPELLADPAFRERLINKARLQNELLVMNMNFDGNPHGVGGLVVEITVRNKGVADNRRRHESLSAQGKNPLGGEVDLADVGDLDDLGFMNLAALQHLCADQDIALEVGLTRDERADETVAFMKLVL